ncbi:MAG TPA: HAMP domain-containing sensor histidine kinase [Candidatus Saccharimonas sp.]|nr:HAMP domain-containing sensor histidine kinase [Candidatus Saccharimonas sp.]
MAIKVHEFFTTYYRKTTTQVVTLQVTGALLASALAWIAWHSFGFAVVPTFIVGVLAGVVVNVLVILLILRLTSAPLRVMSQAVAHVSSDPVVTPPPDINIKQYEQSGLKAMVKTIFELAAAGPSTNETTQTGDFFRVLTDGLPCGVVAMDATGAIVYANSASPVTANSDNVQQLSLIFEQNDDLAKWIADCQANKVRDDHLWLRVADKPTGEDGQRIFDVAGHYQKNAKAGIEVVLVALDRTVAYAPDQDNMDFIALAAHELRGPITVIRGYLEVLKDELTTQLSDDQQILLDRLQVSAERLSGYINNILNVSRYDRSRFTIHLQEENLLDVFKSLVPDLALRASTQRRKLTFQIPQDLPTIAADRTSLSEVIINLIDNAIKYSHEDGEVVIGARRKEDFVEVTVADNGIGMPESVVGNLFNKFYRSHRSREAVAGTGLGLYICKAIVESHGGSIWVRSKEGQGTTFGFTLPIYATVAQKVASGNNKDIVQRSEGWIKNHAMYRR